MKKKKGIISFFVGWVLFAALLLNMCSAIFGAGDGEAAKETSDFTNLVVFVRFDGESEFIDDICGGKTAVRDVVENSYITADYSVRDYYERASFGKVKIRNAYLFNVDGGSLTLSHSRGYYCSKDSAGSEGYSPDEYSARMYELKVDWAEAVNTAIENGSPICDVHGNEVFSYRDLDKNGDGYIDSLTVIYKYSDQYSVSWSDCLWNYQDFYNGVTVTDGDTEIQSGQYLQFTANFGYLYSDKNGTQFASLKTAVHETGHIFGLKDLYRSETNSRVYYMSAMAKAISPVPQYISSKEREALGWIGDKNVLKIGSPGTYSVNVTSDGAENGVICCKIALEGGLRTAYLEYRDFESGVNRYDSQTKEVYNAEGALIKGLTLKSGLVCFLVDRDIKFPNNLNTSGSHWNYEVLGGSYATKSDAALGVGESQYLSANVEVEVISIENGKLTFKITGNGIEGGHVHSTSKIEAKPSTCTEKGNVEHYFCKECGQCFSDEKGEIWLSDKDVAVPTAPHSPGDWIVDRKPTPTAAGERHKECLVCFEVLTVEVIPFENETVIKGDIDGDGRVTSRDVLMFRRYLSGVLDDTGSLRTDSADLDGDGKITARDLVKLRRILSGMT